MSVTVRHVPRPVEAEPTWVWATRANHDNVNGDGVSFTSRDDRRRRPFVTGHVPPGDRSEQPRQVACKVVDAARPSQ